MGLFFKKKSENHLEEHGGIMYLIVGLGNPDKKYENTRHNVGFMALDTIAQAYKVKIDRMKFRSLTTTVTINEHKCLLMKPMTYMNLSGQAVVEAMNFYKIPIERVIVFFDDVSLEPSQIRIRRKGSDGGHNGIKNIIYLSGKDNFPRVKLGVGKKPHPQYDLADWVLSVFQKEDLQKLKQALDHCPEIAQLIVDGQIDKAMNLFNS